MTEGAAIRYKVFNIDLARDTETNYTFLARVYPTHRLYQKASRHYCPKGATRTHTASCLMHSTGACMMFSQDHLGGGVFAHELHHAMEALRRHNPKVRLREEHLAQLAERLTRRFWNAWLGWSAHD